MLGAGPDLPPRHAGWCQTRPRTSALTRLPSMLSCRSSWKVAPQPATASAAWRSATDRSVELAGGAPCDQSAPLSPSCSSPPSPWPAAAPTPTPTSHPTAVSAQPDPGISAADPPHRANPAPVDRRALIYAAVLRQYLTSDAGFGGHARGRRAGPGRRQRLLACLGANSLTHRVERTSGGWRVAEVAAWGPVA
jgi:hypothetical protein